MREKDQFESSVVDIAFPGNLKRTMVLVNFIQLFVPALVSCLGQGPCFSKITYMVTAFNYSEGMYSPVVYCAFFLISLDG